jgi:hypothetical protein
MPGKGEFQSFRATRREYDEYRGAGVRTVPAITSDVRGFAIGGPFDCCHLDVTIRRGDTSYARIRVPYERMWLPELAVVGDERSLSVYTGSNVPVYSGPAHPFSLMYTMRASRLTSNASDFSINVTSLAHPYVLGSKSGMSTESRLPTEPRKNQPFASSN